MKGVSGGLAGWVMLLAAANATAGYVTFTDRAVFEGVTVGLQTIDFEGLAPPGGTYTPNPSLTLDGVTFNGIVPGGNYLFVIDAGFFPSLYDWGSGAVLLGPLSAGDGSQIIVSLPPGTTAFGTDLMTIAPFGASFQVTLGDGTNFTVSTDDYPTRAFFGVVSDIPITSVSFVANDGAFPLLDNFAFGQAVPVPASLVLFGMGALGLATARRVFRKHSTHP